MNRAIVPAEGADTAAGGRALSIRAPEFPSIVVANSFSDSPPGLGLRDPLDLRGGDRLGPDGAVANMVIDWAPGLQAAVWQACRRQIELERPWFAMPPTALIALPGIGSVHLARQISRHAGLPLYLLDLGIAADTLQLQPTHPQWRVQTPAPPILAMAASGCANPIVLVTNIADATEDTLDALIEMIADHSAPRWVDTMLSATIDLSHINWLVQVTGWFPPVLSNVLRPVEIDRFECSRDVADLVAIGVIEEAMTDLNLDGADLEDPSTLLADLKRHAMRRVGMSDLYRLAHGGLLQLAQSR